MGSNSQTSVALFFALNIVFFSLASACDTCPKPRPKPTPSTPSPSSDGKCPVDALKLGVCANVLDGLLNAVVGTTPVTPCCSLIQGLVDLEAAVCLCTVIKADLLGINLNVPISLSLLLNVCDKKVPSGFNCA